MKLVCNNMLHRQERLDPPSELACLAVRLGVEFQGKNWKEQQAERIQVERHMRVCLTANFDFSTVATIAPSEPLLAEAAFLFMTNRDPIQTRPLRALQEHILSSYLRQGDHGELVASLLVLLARDAACLSNYSSRMRPLPEVQQHKTDGSRRIVSVVSFLQELLGPNAESLLDKGASVALPGQESIPLREAFKDASIWFNHIIKVEDPEMIEQKYLCALIIRGAAMLSAHLRAGVDLVVPIVFNNSLKPQNVSAILIRVSNKPRYQSAQSSSFLFNELNPFSVRLFNEEEEDSEQKPVIRMVFALASETPSVSWVPPSTGESVRKSATFTAYDIWCGGVSAKTFAVIHESDEETYKGLSQSTNFFDTYLAEGIGNSPDVSNARRSMHPGVGILPAHANKYMSDL